MDEPVYVIWSFEHDAWWAPDWQGYTQELKDAGRYSGTEAAAIVADANVVMEQERLLTLEHAETLGPPPKRR